MRSIWNEQTNNLAAIILLLTLLLFLVPFCTLFSLIRTNITSPSFSFPVKGGKTTVRQGQGE